MQYTIEGGSLPVVLCRLEPGENDQRGGQPYLGTGRDYHRDNQRGQKGFGEIVLGKPFMSKCRETRRNRFASSFPDILPWSWGTGKVSSV